MIRTIGFRLELEPMGRRVSSATPYGLVCAVGAARALVRRQNRRNRRSFRSASTFTTKVDGHGFGLHSSALAASRMGGSLRAESEGLGHGATFILELPLNAARDLKEKNPP
jgi:hypothetical protein